MQNHGSWSVGLGRWGGILIRLHAFFLLFAAFTLYLSWLADRNGETGHVPLGALSIGILFLSVLLHELGHLYAAQRLGGGGDQLVLGPLGGLQPVRTPTDPQGQLVVHLAGPLVNLCVCMICLPWLLSLEGPQQVVGLLNPLRPEAVVHADATWIVGIKLTFWINWLLFLVNLLPAFPFDGGLAVQSLSELLWADAGRRRGPAIAGACARITAVALLVLAWLFHDAGSELLPLWFPLVLLAIFLFFSARSEKPRRTPAPDVDHVFGYDFSQGYASLEKTAQSTAPRAPSTGLWEHWREQRKVAREQRQVQVEAEDEQRVDQILDQVHREGMQSLSEEDRSVLERVSQRYRDRLGDRT